MKYSIVEISGGIGKNIMATAVIKSIKQQHPDREVLVITAWPDLYVGNPDVYRVFRFGACSYFYNDYVKDKDCMFFCAEPYKSAGYLKQDRHLVESWCDANNITYIDSKGIVPLTPLEIQRARNNINVNKPLLMFQPFGGALDQSNKYSWNRDIPPQQAQQIADILSDKYHIIQPVHDNQIKLSNCEHVTVSLRELFALTAQCQAFIGIDSCLQHLANCYDMPGTVLWVTNSPQVFGYDIHRNIVPDTDKYINPDAQLIDGYMHGYDFSGSRQYDYPFTDTDIFNITEIVEPLLDYSVKKNLTMDI